MVERETVSTLTQSAHAGEGFGGIRQASIGVLDPKPP
jgi:hypothetical protein